MAASQQKRYPAVSGLTWYREQYFSFFVPQNWQRSAWPDGRAGVIYSPDATDPLTVFAVDLRDLGTTITPDDLDVLAEGFFGAIERLPEASIDSRDQKVAGKQLELQAKYTFQEQGETRKRWVRAFYHESRQIIMTAQGATPEKYDYWLPWFFEAMMTAKIHKRKPQSVFEA